LLDPGDRAVSGAGHSCDLADAVAVAQQRLDLKPPGVIDRRAPEGPTGLGATRLGLAMPARMRSWINARSNSAKTADALWRQTDPRWAIPTHPCATLSSSSRSRIRALEITEAGTCFIPFIAPARLGIAPMLGF
jgi:hypothetical protein